MTNKLRKMFNNAVERYGNRVHSGLGDILTTEVSPRGVRALTLAGLIVGSAGLIGATSGCATTHRPKQDNYAYDYKFKNETQDNVPYKLEKVILHGKEFYVQGKNINNQEQLPFVFLPFDKIERVIDLNAKSSKDRVKLESSEKYMPQLVIKEGQRDNYVDILVFRKDDNNKRRISRIRSNIRGVDPNKLCQTQFNGSSILETEQDASYGIRKARIFGEEYFFPHVAESQADQTDRLNFYLVPVKGAKLKIKHSDGTISLENENKVYRPLKVLKTKTLETEPQNAKTPSTVEQEKSK